MFFWYSIWSRTESFGGIGNTRLELSVLGARTTTEVFPVPMAIRRTPRRIRTSLCTRSISPHCKPHTSLIRRPSWSINNMPAFRGVGFLKTNRLTAACSSRESASGNSFVSFTGLIDSSIMGIKCSLYAYLHSLRTRLMHSRERLAPKGLCSPPTGEIICKTHNSNFALESCEIRRSPITGKI